jgi:hypothetical protein
MSPLLEFTDVLDLWMRVWKIRSLLASASRSAHNLSLQGVKQTVCRLLIIQFLFINVPNEQPDGQLQKRHNTETQITKEN